MYYTSVNFRKAWKLFGEFSSWQNVIHVIQKQVMDQGQNLIDFGENRNELAKIPATTESSEDKSAVRLTDIPSSSSESQIALPTSKTSRPNKSLFEITRVEPTLEESACGDDSEFDDTFSETHDSSSTSIVENIKHDDSPDYPDSGIDVVDIKLKPLNVAVENQQPTTSNSTPSSASSTPPVTTVPTTTSEPPSRFRIVKIIKAKPYEKGKWSINDFQDSQKQTESSSDVPASPAVRRSTSVVNKKRNSSGSECKISESSKSVPSPSTTEVVKPASQELFVTTNSRGSSYNTVSGERKISQDRASLPGEGNASGANVTPMVEALESALDQIHSIKESMLFTFTDEMKKLRETIVYLQAENIQLKDENENLKKKLELAETKLLSIDQG